MSDQERSYWQVFNILARTVGLVFVIGGSVVAYQGVLLFFDDQAQVSVNGELTNDPYIKGLPPVMGGLVCALGALVLKARRYRPDLGDSAFSRSRGLPHKDRNG